MSRKKWILQVLIEILSSTEILGIKKDWWYAMKKKEEEVD